MNLSAIFSKTGKGVQEASGKTSHLSRADRAVLAAVDGKTLLGEVHKKFEKIAEPKFEALIQQLEKDGFIREVSSGSAQPAAAPMGRSAAPPPPRKAPPAGGDDEVLDFTQAVTLPKAPPPASAPTPPKSPPVDLAAASRAEADRAAKEQQAFDYKARAEADARTRAEAEAKVKAAREAAVRMATEVKARAEAEGKAKADAAAEREREALEKARRESEDKARLEAELTGKLEQERRAREDAERRASEAAERTRKELEEKAKRDAEELRQRLEAEMRAKLEQERKLREEEDRKRREEDDRRRAEEDRKRREEEERRRKEEEARRAKEEAERRAREEADRKRREEEDRKRAEEEKQRKEEEARRAKEEAERRAREEADRKRREEEDRKRAEEEKRRKEDEARRAKEEAERRAKEEAERRRREDAERKAREETERRAKEDAERRAKEEAEAKARAAQIASAQSASGSTPSIQPAATSSAPPPVADDGLGDSLLADLDSFGRRDEEEQKAKEEAERQAKEGARKAKEEAERRAKDDAENRAREAAEKKRRDEEARKAKQEAEQRAREDEERQKQEIAEFERKAKEAFAAEEAQRKARQQAAAAKTAGKDDDIGVTDADLDMDDVRKDEKALSAEARTAAREREQPAAPAAAARRPTKWRKPAAIALVLLLIGGVGVLNVMPVSTAEYEKAASDAMGAPVKIGSARLSVITGIEVRFENVSIGDAVKIRAVRGFPEFGSLFGAKKSFSRIELEGASLQQSQLAEAVLGKVSGENFRVGRIVIKQAKLDGPLTLPALDVDAAVSGDGSVQSVTLRGGDKLNVRLSPKGSDIGFEIDAGSLALPFVPALSLSDFGMKGTANRDGVTMSEFDGRAFEGVISGSAKIRWGANWLVDGEVRVRGVKIGVIAPALVSEGKVEGRGTYTMSGPNPATLFEKARLQGGFKIENGVLGSFDLTRALQTGGAQTGGRTVFTELTGQALYDKGAVKLSNVAVAAGAMNAGASLEVDANGGLSGRIVADVKTANQTLRATLNISGKIQDPVIRK